MVKIEKLNQIIRDVRIELAIAQAHNNEFNSAHEGYAVIKEEFDELWEEVKKKPNKRDIEKLRKESIQIAAMAIRFIYDIC